jgi:hypothetical protein
LGMKVDQVLAVFPGSKDDSEIRSDLSKPTPLGVTNIVVTPEKFGLKDNFPNIRSFTVSFMDGRLLDINAGYSGFEWKHVDDFVARFSEGWALPPIEAWNAYVGMDDQLKTLKCNGFEISVFASKGGNADHIQMRDLAADKELKERRAKARAKLQKDAKP